MCRLKQEITVSNSSTEIEKPTAHEYSHANFSGIPFCTPDNKQPMLNLIMKLAIFVLCSSFSMFFYLPCHCCWLQQLFGWTEACRCCLSSLDHMAGTFCTYSCCRYFCWTATSAWWHLAHSTNIWRTLRRMESAKPEVVLQMPELPKHFNDNELVSILAYLI